MSEDITTWDPDRLDELARYAHDADPSIEWTEEPDDNAPHGANTDDEMDGSR
jgi:hypothetical protein